MRWLALLLALGCSAAPPRGRPPCDACEAAAVEPPSTDRDADRILDVDDLCPTEPEDCDAFEDEDGCPERDNDKDDFVDAEDCCPNDPESLKPRERDGCPDAIRDFVLHDGQPPAQFVVRLSFAPGVARLDCAALATLQDVLATVSTREKLVKLRVIGLVAAGEAPALAIARAQHVVEAMVARGFDRAKLVGETGSEAAAQVKFQIDE